MRVVWPCSGWLFVSTVSVGERYCAISLAQIVPDLCPHVGAQKGGAPGGGETREGPGKRAQSSAQAAGPAAWTERGPAQLCGGELGLLTAESVLCWASGRHRAVASAPRASQQPGRVRLPVPCRWPERWREDAACPARGASGGRRPSPSTPGSLAPAEGGSPLGSG